MSDDYDHPYTEKLTYYYDSCPNSVNKLIQNIIDDMKKTYLYRADGSPRDDVYNCFQMACKWLKDSGFRPPFNPNEKIMPSPIPFGKGGYDPHPKRRIIRE